MKKGLLAGTALSLASVLVACGGGGGGSGTISPASTDYNLQAGVTDMVAHGLAANVSLSGTALVNGNSTPFSGSGTYSLAPSTATNFDNGSASAQVQTISGNVTAAGQTAPYTATVTDYYASSNSAFLGEVDSNEYDVAQAPIQFPTSVVGGSGGVLGTLSRYTDQTMSVVLGTSELSYAVTAAASTGGPLKVALTTKSYDQQHNLLETDVMTYSLTTSNAISFVSGSVQNQSGSLTATAN